jgi:hypothetical protein
MKTNILLISLAFVSFGACGQKAKNIEVPSVIENTLKTKFPGATTIEWKKKDSIYEAEFKIGKTEWNAAVELSGSLLKTKYDLTETELPSLVKDAISKLYKEYKLDEIEKLEINGLSYYQVELDGKPKDLELVFEVNGSLSQQILYWD